MAITTQRNGPSQQASSQVTAPVYEFRCLFTHDIRKKQKKWHDGRLWFHTFNKKVRVQDDQGNSVGSLHYRDTEDFGEGSELKLDQPVLVQVEEKLNESETDLTALLNRQDANTNSDGQPAPARSTLARPSYPPVRNKSIKDILPPSQGRIGRAVMPRQPTSHQRIILAEVSTNPEPPAKRRKGSVNEDIGPRYQPALESSSQSGAVNARAVSPIDITEVCTQTQVDSVAQVTEQSSLEAIATQVSKKNRSKQLPHFPELARRKERCIGDHSGQKKHHQSGSRSHTVSGGSISIPMPLIATIQSKKRAEGKEKGLLSFPSRKTRPKLLCLNPSAASTPEQDRASRRRSKQNNISLVDFDDEFAPSQIARDLVSAVKPLSSGSAPRNDDCLEATSLPPEYNHNVQAPNQEPVEDNVVEPPLLLQSPFFIPQSQLHESPHRLQHADADDFEAPVDGAIMENPAAAEELIDQPSDMSNKDRNSASSTASSPGFAEELARRTAALKGRLPNIDGQRHEHLDGQEDQTPAVDQEVLEKQDNILDCHSAAGNLISKASPAARIGFRVPDVQRLKSPFRRAVSEQSPTRTWLDDFDDNFSEPRSQHLEAQLLSGQSLHQKNRFSPDRKVMSDPAVSQTSPLLVATSPRHFQGMQNDAEAAAVSHVAVVNAEQPAPDPDTGPWSTIEAYILFESWPSGKQKPDYGQHATCQNRGTARNAITRALPNKYASFTSARLVSQS